MSLIPTELVGGCCAVGGVVYGVLRGRFARFVRFTIPVIPAIPVRFVFSVILAVLFFLAVLSAAQPSPASDADLLMPRSDIPAHNSTIPDSTLPNSTIPNSALPDSALPNSTALNSVAPNPAAPNPTPPATVTVTQHQSLLNRLTSIIPFRQNFNQTNRILYPQENSLPGFGNNTYNENNNPNYQYINQLNKTQNNTYSYWSPEFGGNIGGSNDGNLTGNIDDNPFGNGQNYYQSGSLELVPNYFPNIPQTYLHTTYTPSIYIDGTGYVPLSHPSIEPYIDPVKDSYMTNPNIVLVPEFLQTTPAFYLTNTQPPNFDYSGKTTLSMPSMQDYSLPITVSAKNGWTKKTDKYDVLFLSDDCTIRQGNNSVQAPNAVVWISRETESKQMREVAVYLESESQLNPLVLEFDPETVDAQIIDKRWFGRFVTSAKVQTLIMNTEPEQELLPVIYKRALRAMNPEHPVIEQAQYTAEIPQPKPKNDTPPYRRISLNPRGDNDMSIDVEPVPDNPDRAIFIISKGINLIIEGVNNDNILNGDVVDISADHAIIWSVNPKNFQQNRTANQDSKSDFEVYLEGNIIFRDGERIIKAKRMYYDAKNKIAYIIDGEMSMPLVGIKGINATIRIKSEILQKIGEGSFAARNALVTTSSLGQPTWSLRSRRIALTDKYYTSLFSSEVEKRQIMSAENNTLVIGGVPVFYWPWLAADANDPTYYLKSISVGSSGYYGYNVRTEWNPFQLFNIQNRPDWLDGSLGISWMEKRGIGHGLNLNYSPPECFGIKSGANGALKYWGVNDISLGDQLGGGRNLVPFPQSYRYTFAWNHRQELKSFLGMKGNWSIAASAGKVSDRNVLPYYNNAAWINDDNRTTSVEVAKTSGETSLKLRAERSLDDFYTNANQLPRLDHYIIGKSFLQDHLTLYTHTRVGYIDYNSANSPYAPNYAAWYRDARLFRYLPWELSTSSLTSAPPSPTNPSAAQPDTIDVSFEIFSSRAEVDLPLQVGAFKVVPYVLGDFSHWGKNRSGNDEQRFYYQGGVRMSIPFWRVMPNCSSRTWNVNGLAHKIVFDAEVSYSQANKGMEELILTDSLDSWSVEDFRRRYSVTSFGSVGGVIPLIFDPRYYAYRSGLAGNVSAGNMEIADDLTLARFGMTHRFQTKRGPVGKRHIIDWITLSTHLNYYPDESQNFGENVGLIDYDFLWHVGDRFSIFSSGLYDIFDGGQEITRIGGIWNRPKRGSISVMYDHLFGSAIKRDYLTLQFSYTMNEKYAMSYSTSYDITKNPWQNVGHNFMFTRTGESFRLMMGAVYSESLQDWGFTFGLEPVFMYGIASKMQRMSSLAQQQLAAP
ncbi:MAG: hypothetical protein LBQ66_05025 [Planctomycetaceae bacterium]|nr:hypothetical protein [Planctomycetaceae bacterium]